MSFSIVEELPWEHSHAERKTEKVIFLLTGDQDVAQDSTSNKTRHKRILEVSMSLSNLKKDAELKRLAGNEAFRANDLHKAEELYARCIQLSKQSADPSLSLALSNRCQAPFSPGTRKLL